MSVKTKGSFIFSSPPYIHPRTRLVGVIRSSCCSPEAGFPGDTEVASLLSMELWHWNVPLHMHHLDILHSSKMDLGDTETWTLPSRPHLACAWGSYSGQKSLDLGWGPGSQGH